MTDSKVTLVSSSQSSKPNNESKSSETINIQNPFSFYPRFPFHPYNNLDVYLPEVKRLFATLKTIQKEILENKIRNPLLHISIGSPMEERHHELKENIYLQWKQLYPSHIEDYILQNKYVYHIIVSPDGHFNPSNYSHPLFTTCSNLAWKYNKDKNMYTHKNCQVFVFNTPMPHNSQKTINFKIDSLLPETREAYFDFDFNTLKQTDEDLKFITAFYENFGNLLDTISIAKGITTCFSFAVFHNMTMFRNMINYVMFSEIRKYFTEDFEQSNRLLAEWTYSAYNYNVTPFNAKSVKNKEFTYIIHPEVKHERLFCDDNQLYIS